jgi:O-antigen ligase
MTKFIDIWRNIEFPRSSDLFSDRKWIGFFILQVIIGISCVVLPWHFAVMLAVFIVFITVLHIKFRWWAFIIIFFLPFMGVKYPGFYFDIPGFSEGDSVPLLLIISCFATMSLFLHKFMKSHKQEILGPLIVPIIILVCYGWLTFFWSPADVKYNLFYFIFLLINIFLFIFMYSSVDSEEIHRKLMWCLIFSGLFLAIQTFISLFPVIETHKIRVFDWLILNLSQRSIKGDQSGTAHGFFMGTQETGMVMDIILFVAIGLLLTEKHKSRIWFLRVAIFLLYFAIFFTKTKAAVWSLFMMSYIILFINPTLRKKFIRNAFIITTIIFLAFTVTSQFKGSKSKSARVLHVSLDKGTSIGKRIEYWQTGFKELDKRSLTPLGLGIAGFKSTSKRQHVAHAHNLYLSVFFDYGFAGIIVIFTVILTLAKSFWRSISDQSTYLQNMSLIFGVNLCVIGLIGIVYIPYYMSFLWFVIAIALATFKLAQQESKNDSLSYRNAHTNEDS